ncbi:MAG: 3-isopropylmalate dehydratase [bacterium]
MQEIIEGKAFVLGDNIDTDQIIPAEHLVYDLDNPEERKNYGRFCFSSVPIEVSGLPQGHVRFMPEGSHESQYRIVVAGSNFGCGSSREHAPVALNVAGVRAVVAESYARIFFRNSVNGGYLIPFETPEKLNGKIKTGDTIRIDVSKETLTHVTEGWTVNLSPLGDVKEIIKVGDVFAYAKASGMI